MLKAYIVVMWILVILGVYFIYDKYSYILEYYFNRYFNYATLSIPPSKSRNLLLYSNSTMSLTGDHLGYGRPSLEKFLKPHGVKQVLFIPYAWPNIRDGVDTQAATKMYKESVLPAFKSVGCDVKLLDTNTHPDQQISEINNAQAVYMCGGNTFWLTKALHQPGVAQALRNRINEGMPYVSASAGTNATCPTMQTTNDMPNCCVDGCDVLGVLPFQINVHYNDYTEGHGFGGESRALRLCEYLQGNRTFDNGDPTFVLCLREGSMLHVSGDKAELLGLKSRPSLQLQILNGKLTRTNISIGTRVDGLLKQIAFK